MDVVVPVLNGGERFLQWLDGIAAQSLEPRNVIVADNGSSDGTVEAATRFGATVVHEPVRSSYAARNRALLEVTADVVAFIDGDCVPEPQWLAAGVAAMAAGLDLVGGRVDMEPATTAAGRHDRLNYLNQQRNVDAGFAATANLFVRRDVLRKLGGFDASLISGGDMAMTKKAVAEGFRLGYCDAARVSHPPREGLREVLAKAWRIGTGHGVLAAHDDEYKVWMSWKKLKPHPIVLASGDRAMLAVEIAYRFTAHAARWKSYLTARRAR